MIRLKLARAIFKWLCALRKFAREGSADHLDLEDTIRSTARNAGYARYKNGAGAKKRREGANFL